jgi:hypothetical protein
MKEPSEAIKDAIASTISPIVDLIIKAHEPVENEAAVTEFSVNCLVNVIAKFILADAVADCAARMDSADDGAVALLATLNSAKFVSAIPQALVSFFEANAAAEVKAADLIRKTNDAAAHGSVQ